MNLTSESHINQLESSLAQTLAALPESLASLSASKADAQKLLAQYVASPIADTLARLKAAHGSIAATEAILGAIGHPAAWPAKIESAWACSNFQRLVELLGTVIHERSARRQAFRDAAAQRLGELTTAIVRADGNNAADSTLESLNAKLAGIEDDLARREALLNTAIGGLKIFKATGGVDPGPQGFHGAIFTLWENAKHAALQVDFEPHLSDVEKHVAAHPIQKAVVTPTRRSHTPIEAGDRMPADGRHD